MSTPATGTHRVTLTNVFSGTMITGFTDSTLEFNLGTNTLFAPNVNATTFTGALSGNASSASLVDVNSFTTGTFDVVLVDGAGSTQQLGRDAGFRYDPNSNQIEVTGGATIDDVTIGVAGATEINTTSGNLILDSAGGTVQVTDDLSCVNFSTTGNNTLGNGTGDLTTVSGKLQVNSTTQSTTSNGSIITEGGLLVKKEIRSLQDIIAFASSDQNLKDNITVIPNALDKVNALSGNTFTWKGDAKNYDYLHEGQDTGVIAQEVEALGLPGTVTTRSDGTKAVRYERLIPVLIQAVKELSAKVTALEGS